MARMKRMFKTFTNGQKLRVVVGNGSITVFTRVVEVIDPAILDALTAIDNLRKVGDPCVGLTGTFKGKSLQVDLVK